MTNPKIDDAQESDDNWDGTDIEPVYVRKTVESDSDDEYAGYIRSYSEGDKFS